MPHELSYPGSSIRLVCMHLNLQSSMFLVPDLFPATSAQVPDCLQAMHVHCVAGSDFQAEDTCGKHTQLSAHPLSLRQLEMPQLESGWLVDAVHQRFPEIGQHTADPGVPGNNMLHEYYHLVAGISLAHAVTLAGRCQVHGFGKCIAACCCNTTLVTASK